MQLTLLLPGLLWPRRALEDIVFDLSAPALSLMLGRGRVRWQPTTTAHTWLAHAWGLDNAPLAALRRLGEAGEPRDAHWLCLDPVHLRLEEWSLVPDDPSRLALTAEEDAALREAAAPLFAKWGTLSARRPGCWYLECASAPALMTMPLSEAIGRPVDPALPGGNDGVPWRRQLAEAQTLLHDHPVNVARKAAGKPTVNSLWPWGGGRLIAKPAPAAPWEAVYGNDPVLAGLAVLADIAPEPLPERFAPLPARHLVLVDELIAPAQTHDALAWREALVQLDDRLLAPALLALRAGQLRQVRLVAFGGEATLDITFARSDSWRFWRRPRPLTDLAP
jgi:hypothetical protein